MAAKTYRIENLIVDDNGQINSESGILHLQRPADGNVTVFRDSASSGETQEFLIYGYRFGDAQRNLQIAVGIDADDTASFDGLSNYYFDGNLVIGTAVAEAKLHVFEGNSGVTPGADSHIFGESDGNMFMELAAGAEADAGILLTTPDVQFSMTLDGGEEAVLFNLGGTAFIKLDVGGDLITLGEAGVNTYVVGKLGVGIAAGDGTCHIHSGSAGSITANSSANELVLENDDACGMSILAPDDKSCYMFFGTPGQSLGAQIQWFYGTGGASKAFVLKTSVAGGTINLKTGNDVEAIRFNADQDIEFPTAGSGLATGGISVKDNTNSITLNATPVQITAFDTNDPSNGSIIPDHTNAHITLEKNGLYKVTVSLTIRNDDPSTHDVGISLYKNNGNTEFENVHAHRTLSGGSGDIGSMSLSGNISGTAGDTIELWIDTDGTNEEVIIEDCTMTADQKGG